MQNESKRKSFCRNQITNVLCFLTINNKTRSGVLGPHSAWWLQCRPCSLGAWPGLYSVGPCPQRGTPYLPGCWARCVPSEGPRVSGEHCCPSPGSGGLAGLTPKRAVSLYVMFYFAILHQCFF